MSCDVCFTVSFFFGSGATPADSQYMEERESIRTTLSPADRPATTGDRSTRIDTQYGGMPERCKAAASPSTIGASAVISLQIPSLPDRSPAVSLSLRNSGLPCSVSVSSQSASRGKA